MNWNKKTRHLSRVFCKIFSNKKWEVIPIFFFTFRFADYILMCLFFSICIFGQPCVSKELPESILEQFDKIGVDNTSYLNDYEGELLNIIFKKERANFDFKNKKIIFLTGSTGKAISNKSRYFSELKEFSVCKTTYFHKGILYIFDDKQKKENGGHDVAIAYWVKILPSVNRRYC